MPAISHGRRRVVDSESDSESASAGNDDAAGDQPYLASNGAKRVRITPQPEVKDEDSDRAQSNANDDSDTSVSEARPSARRSLGALKPGSPESSNVANGITNGAGSGTYRRGAIVRIKLENFVTYTSVELRPGPQLNLVIGPNGTGKSTLVCAICLGLGESTALLGRARDANDFIKMGCAEATIEIELAGGSGERNRIITRHMKREASKSTYFIDGKMANATKVRKLARDLSIQIDNLCQFLPQDKVCEFAGLTPVQLLQSTQRAAAPPKVTEDYEKLKDLRVEQKKFQLTNAQQREQLQNMEKRQASQREEVEKLRQRAAVQKRLECLEQTRPLVQFRDAKAEYLQVTLQRTRLGDELKELEDQEEPTMRAIRAKETYYQQYSDGAKQKRKNFAQANDFGKKIIKEIASLDQTVRKRKTDVESEKQKIRRTLDDVKQVKQSINRMEGQIKAGAPEYDSSVYSEKIRDIIRHVREIQSKAEGLQDKKRELSKHYQKHREDFLKCKNRLDSLQRKDGQQEERLRRISKDTYDAWDWLKDEDNQKLFEKPVYGPPLVVCSVKDPKYAPALEGLISQNDLCSFTAQTLNDFKKLQDIFSRKKGLRITFKTCTAPLEKFQPPISDETLREMGFDGWAKGYITGPEPVLAMLCSENGFHSTPIMSRDITDAEYRNLEGNNRLSTWIAGRKAYSIIRRREYGPSATSTRVRQLRSATYWTDTPVDDDVRQEIESDMQRSKNEMDELEKKMLADKDEVTHLSTKHQEATAKRKQLEKEKAEKQTALTTFRALPSRLSQQKEKYAKLEAEVANAKQRIQEHRKKQDLVVMNRAALALKYAAFVTELREMHEDLLVTSLQVYEAMSDFQGLKTRNAEVHDVIEEKKREIDKVSIEITTRASQLRAMKQIAKRLSPIAERDPVLKEIIDEVAQLTMDQLEAEIDSAKARLALNHDSRGPRFIDEFEQRQVQIDKLKATIEEGQKKLDAFAEEIAEVRAEWEPKLEEVVERISASFSDFFARIGCAGQVSINKGEDLMDEDGRTGNTSNFEKWSIRIQVKFRENEALATLDSHRQSGGERAVSTIFYLMALQSLSPSPFRVVDEINQGMDPRNERMVHERMVEIACGQANSDDSGGQYFLITPKLLSGLRYQPGMTILCIYSGEYMPDDFTQLDLRRCIKRMKDVKAEEGGRMVGVGT